MRFAERVSQLKPSPTLAISAKAKEMKKFMLLSLMAAVWKDSL